MAKTPPRRSYRLFSGMICLACACALSPPAKATGATASASPATTPRLVIEVETACVMGHLLGDVPKGIAVPSVCELYWRGDLSTCQTGLPACSSRHCICLVGALRTAHLDGFRGEWFPS